MKKEKSCDYISCHSREFLSGISTALNNKRTNEVPDYKSRGRQHFIKAFTLIELLVVVLIIGILSAIALPQYQKAVIKARFAETLPNLKTIGEAEQVCFLEKGSECDFNEIAITPVGEVMNSGREVWTENFIYRASLRDVMENPIWGYVQYHKEDVCICYLQTGEFVLNQDHEGGCTSASASYDYAKLLGLREVSYDECGCC